MSIRAAGRSVAIAWSPSDLRGPDSDGHVGRDGERIRAIVYHRIVGTLETTVNQTFYPTTDDLMTAGERRVSSHFSIGFWGGELLIVQHVALENTAYCNGQSARDRTACTWRTWIDAGRPDANEMTVSIEHEDNAAAGNYIVREEIIQASIELSRLLLSGNGKAIRAAGIRCSDTAAAQLGRITPSAQTLVPHRTVCPITKPYCWTAYKGDKGFPQARYVAALTSPAEVEDMPGLDIALDVTRDLDPSGDIGTATLLPDARIRAIRVRDMGLVDLPDGAVLGVVQRGRLVTDQTIGGAVRPAGTEVAVFNHDGRLHAALWSDIGESFKPLALGTTEPSTPEPTDCGPALAAYKTRVIDAIEGVPV